MNDRLARALRRIGRAYLWISAALVSLAVVLAAYALWRVSIDEAEAFADPVAHFKYGSTGGDRNFGLPYQMWEAMPVLFRDLLPPGREDEGWAAFGFLYEDPADLPEGFRRHRPVGTSLRKHMGVERIFLNCAGCHAGRVRDAGGRPVIVAGAPSNTVDLSAFQSFLAAAVVDERFTAGDFIGQIKAMGLDLDLFEELALRAAGVSIVRDRLLAIVDRFDDFVAHSPTYGPGRFDTFNPAKALLNWNFDDLAERELIGVVDFPSIWMQGAKQGMQLHWDGNNTKVSERNRSAAFGTGATPPLLDRASLKRFEDWLAIAEPPSFASFFPDAMQPDLAAIGAPIYAAECARCHGAGGRDFSAEAVGKVTPIAQIATDRARFDNYTYDLAVNQNALYAGFGDERFQTFRKTAGYANAPLDGLWLRAPYLHNGSVPTLWDLLQTPDRRPKAFLRGHDVYDPVNMGFESRPESIPADARGRLFCYVVDAAEAWRCPAGAPPMNGVCEAGACKGNGNQGHLYGTWLSDDEKRALIAHLRTF
jgi:mono/diheme cytochrome c family protein